METKKIKVNGITIRYLDIKNDDKDTIVFLHYGGSTLAVWNGVIPYFQNDYRIIAADLRGHGHSEKPETNYHIDDMAKDIFELMNALDVKQAHIIGSSLGADVAISITANYPEKVLSMILDGGFYDLVGPDSKEQTISEDEIKQKKQQLKDNVLSRPLKIYDTKEDYITANKTSWEKYFPWSEIAKKAVEDELIQDENGKYRGCQTPEVIWKYIEPLYDVRFADYYPKINCPILFLPDEKEMSSEIVKQNIEKYKKNLPYSKVVIIPGSVHAYTCLLKPKEFSNEIRIFFDEIKGS